MPDLLKGIRSAVALLPLAGLSFAGPAVGLDAWAVRADESERAAVQPIRYDRDIRPFLADRCFKCHGPDTSARQAELRLDERDQVVADRGGYAVVVPGSPETSEMFRRITSGDVDERMPPPESNKRPLTPDEQALVQQWILEGARYEPHWSFVPPVRPPLPEVRGSGRYANPIDRFVVHQLQQASIEPSPAADAETLIRRLFLDLTGLPPTPEEIDQFLADYRDDAYEHWVARLLDEEPYRSRGAEHFAAAWLDAARFADTIGIHTDAGRQMWAWRDWVLRAFRDNMPFDRFLTEQLAGDLLPNATLDQKIASGFNRNHVMTDEGGAIPEEYLIEYAVDRATTTGAVFLGLTLGCARCHEHKFDPISQEDFYRFLAFFNSIDEPGLYSQLPDPKRAFEPFIQVPAGAQEQRRSSLKEQLEEAHHKRAQFDPTEDEQRVRYFDKLAQDLHLTWPTTRTISADSQGGATLTIRPDGTVLASGANPDRDTHVIKLRTEARGMRWLALEAIPDPLLPNGAIGRAPNGNAVLTGVEAQAIAAADPGQRADIRFIWAWASHEQDNGDHAVVNCLDPDDERGWAVDAHRQTGGRVALLLADQPFGYEGGTEVVVRLSYQSVYAQHVLGNVRLRLGTMADEGLPIIPAASSFWFTVGPFPLNPSTSPYETSLEPERQTALELNRNFGFGNQFWKQDANLRDGRLNSLASGTNISYVAKVLFAPTARPFAISVGSDDGFQLFLNGQLVAQREIDRALAADQDQVDINLARGTNLLVLKIVNTGGEAGFYFRSAEKADELSGNLVAGILPEGALDTQLAGRLNEAWRMRFSPAYRALNARIESLEKELAQVESEIPLTMVMQELPQPRATYVLTRGQYDRPDTSHKLPRGVPPALGSLPAASPQNRLGLAHWMTSAENPLVSRVAVNRLWEHFFGTGLVRTSEDFGLQGEWPSHPELLDWLAVELRESGWNRRHLIRLIVTSATYRQSSQVRTELRERDPDNRLLACFPRRRLTAEQIRDQALYVSGLLVEQFGGPSVKPYQPDGLWQEVAMPQSNTRVYERGDGADLWRRSTYTYWKRACPPPFLLTMDAPTREFCTIRRSSTNTPLQALALWNDPQFVEAARVLAQRTWRETNGSVTPDSQRLARMLRRCTGRHATGAELERLSRGLETFRHQFRQAPQGARQLVQIGEAPVADDIPPPELAAWTMIASTLLNLSETLTQR